MGTNFGPPGLMWCADAQTPSAYSKWPQRLAPVAGVICFVIRVPPEHLRMPHYSFHFHGKKSVVDFFDDTFPDDQEATRYAEAMSAKFQADMPNMCEGGYIAMTTEDGREVTRIILSSIH